MAADMGGGVIAEDAGFRQLFPGRDSRQVFSDRAFREIVSRWVDGLMMAEQTLAKVDDPDVKVVLFPGRIRLAALPRQGRPRLFAPGRLFELVWFNRNNQDVDGFELHLDLGDAYWLRGYLHLQAAVGEILLAHDWQPVIEVSGHLWFEKVETPHQWLLEPGRADWMNLGGPGGWTNGTTSFALPRQREGDNRRRPCSGPCRQTGGDRP